MEEKDRSDTIAVHPVESGTLPLRQHDQAQDQESEQQQDYRGSDEPLFFTYRTKNKVGILLRYILQLGLRTVQKAFSGEPARTDRDLRLVHIIAGTARIVFQSQ